MKIVAKNRDVGGKIICRLLFRIILDLSYYICIIPYWSYSHGFNFDFTIFKVVISYLLLFPVCLLTPRINNELSSIFLNTQLYVSLIPMMTLYAYSDRQLYVLIFLCLVHLMQCLFIKFMDRVNYRAYTIKDANSLEIGKLLMISITLITVGITFTKYGISNGLTAFNLLEVYSIREVASSEMNLLTGYFVPWTTKIIIPFGIVYSLYCKKKGLLVGVILIQLYLYTAYASKSILFTVLLVLLVYFAISHNKIKLMFEKGLTIAFGMITVAEFFLQKWTMVSSLFIRRVCFVPAALKYYYFDFFAVNKKVFYADGIIGKIFGIKSSYGMSIQKLLASYIGQPASYCNTGYLGESFANAGYVGVIIISLLVIVFIWEIKRFTQNIDKVVVYSSAFYLIYSFNEGAFFTIMFTYGGILYIVLCIFIDSGMRYQNRNKLMNARCVIGIYKELKK